MRILSILGVALLLAPALEDGCGGTKNCSRNADCDSDEACLYLMGSCSARGECKKYPDNGSNGCGGSLSGCGALTELCGCDGSPVTTGCGYPDNYASGPTPATWSMPSVCPNAGNEGGLDAGELDAPRD